MTADLPRATPPFGGKIGRLFADAEGAALASPEPPVGGANIVLIMLDDVGFGSPATFGGPVPMQTVERVAQAGLRFNQFHTTALCSPTRAALLTGRNDPDGATQAAMRHGAFSAALRAQ